MEGFDIVKLSDEHFKLLLPLYSKAFGQSMDEHELRTKFDTLKICGEKNVGFIALNEKGEAAAFYGVFPCYAIKGDNQVLIAQSGDTMVDAKYRRKKLFVKLAETTFEYCRAKNIKAVFGFPNIYSFPSFVKKLKWTHIHNIVSYQLRVKCLPFIRIRKLFKLKEDFFLNYQLRYLRRQSKKVKEYHSINQNISNYTINKNKQFIEYKAYFEKYFLNLSGVNVWVKPNAMFLLVGDVEDCDEVTFVGVLDELKKIAFRLGIPHIRIQMSPETKLETMAKKYLYKMDNEYPAGGISFDSNFNIHDLRFVLADYDTF